jgi:hypothetical protein
MRTNVRKRWYLSPWRLLLMAICCWYSYWGFVVPSVDVYYSENATEPLRVIWNTQNSIYRAQVLPGEMTGDFGHLFPDDSFFMEFDFWTDGGAGGCVSITPKWLTTNIYIGSDGEIDMSPTGGTDTDRIRPCR